MRHQEDIRYHGKLIGIYNESPTFKEGIVAAVILGIPLALIFAIIVSLL